MGGRGAAARGTRPVPAAGRGVPLGHDPRAQPLYRPAQCARRIHPSDIELAGDGHRAAHLLSNRRRGQPTPGTLRRSARRLRRGINHHARRAGCHNVFLGVPVLRRDEPARRRSLAGRVRGLAHRRRPPHPTHRRLCGLAHAFRDHAARVAGKAAPTFSAATAGRIPGTDATVARRSGTHRGVPRRRTRGENRCGRGYSASVGFADRQIRRRSGAPRPARQARKEISMTATQARAVRFDQYGGRDVLYVADIEGPAPGPGEGLVEVRAAGINPGEAGIRSGALREQFPATFPSGEGSDLAGVVVQIGDDVSDFAVGDEVLGFSFQRSSHATHTVVPVDQLIHKPAQLSWEAAGSLYVVAATAYAAVHAVAPQPGETVAVSAAAGGVGSLVVQLLTLRDVRVLGIASANNAEWLRAHGVVPVEYGDGLAERLRQAAPDGIDAFIDLFGPDYVQLAVDLGVPPERIDTIISFAKAAEVGAKTEGSAEASTPAVLTEIADLVASGAVDFDVAATYPLDRVADAYEELEQRHTHGKIVLVP